MSENYYRESSVGIMSGNYDLVEKLRFIGILAYPKTGGNKIVTSKKIFVFLH